ncbi:MAG TPA: NUDIX hydrolase [Thermomicrobiaceae bacterium]|nr:NUDIX hydrolase [Thermomicrobiaceae bacterium]
MSYNFAGEIRYCPHCGQPVAAREAFGRLRPFCSACKVTFFQDPKLAVAVVIDDGQRVILQRRAVDPGRGAWSFPSGFVERGEPVEDAARREVAEETGLEIRLRELLGLFSEPGNPVVLAVYLAEPLAGRLTPDRESLELAAFPPDTLPPLAFDHDSAIVEAWLARRNRATIGE